MNIKKYITQHFDIPLSLYNNVARLIVAINANPKLLALILNQLGISGFSESQELDEKAKSRQQLKMIYAKRSQYGNKSKTPEKWNWIWSEEWTDVKMKELPKKVNESKLRKEIRNQIKSIISEKTEKRGRNTNCTLQELEVIRHEMKKGNFDYDGAHPATALEEVEEDIETINTRKTI